MSYETYSQSLVAVRPEPPQPAAHPANLTSIIGRMTDAIEEETQGIRTDMRFDVKASNARKGRYLYELTRAMRGLTAADIGQEQELGLKRLRERLAANEAAIRAHLDAVGEVAALMQNALQRAEADGTYSAGEFGR
jgi:hypothetical protein